MSRTKDPLTPYRVGQHFDKGYHYAYVQRDITCDEANERKRRKQLLGTVGKGNEFLPNDKFRLMPIEERRKLIFPEDWDLRLIQEMDPGYDYRHRRFMKEVAREESATSATISEGICGISPSEQEEEQYNNRFYGDIWLLEEILKSKGVVDDLLDVFNGDVGMTNDVLTLSLYPSLTGGQAYYRLEKWQNITYTPSMHRLKSDYITRLMQVITENHRAKLISRRLARQPQGTLAACDSTTVSSYGRCLADIRWGNNKDREDLPCVVEVVVYCLATHEPVYYRTFPGFTSDISTIRTIIRDLKEFGLTDLIVITDRGYCSNENIGYFVKNQLPFITCSKAGQSPVIDVLQKIIYDKYGLPMDMQYDEKAKLYYRQFPVDPYRIMLSDGTSVEAKGIVVNAYLDIRKRAEQLDMLRRKIALEDELLRKHQSGEIVLPDTLQGMRKALPHYSVSVDKKTEVITFTRNDNKIEKDAAPCGFFSSLMYLQGAKTAMEAYHEYKLRDEQEKYFFTMKDIMAGDTTISYSEEARKGRDFVLFVGLIAMSWIRYKWAATDMRRMFRSSEDILDAMRPIRYCTYSDGSDHITTFTAQQISICDYLEVQPPKNCMSVINQRRWQQSHEPKKRGRKPKPKPKSITLSEYSGDQ